MPSRSKWSSSNSKDEDSISPPTYRVVEDELGDLRNPDLKVKYPERPKKGRYSLSNYLHCRKKAKKIDKRYFKDDDSVKSETSRRSKRRERSSKPSSVCRCECGRCCCRATSTNRRREQRRQSKSKIPPAISLDALIVGRNSPSGSDRDNSDFEKRKHKRSAPKSVGRMKLPPISPNISLSSLSIREKVSQSDYNHDRMTITEPLRKVVVGPQNAGVVADMLTPTQFLLYYRRADYVNSIDDVPLSEPLTMAYKSSDNKVFHYKICFVLRGGRKLWRIDHGSDSKQHREFTSLERLILYYKEFQTLSGDAL